MLSHDAQEIASHMLIVCGPSGSGKSTLIAHLLERRRSCELSRSMTTRAPRGIERDGLEYDFVDLETFNARIEEDAFAEYAKVFGHYYGTPHSMIREKIILGLDVVFDIDVQGARQLKKRYPGAWCMLISPPSFEILEKRLRARATDSPEVIASRLKIASDEMSQRNLFDFIVINDDLATASDKCCAIYDAMRLRSKRGDNQVIELA